MNVLSTIGFTFAALAVSVHVGFTVRENWLRSKKTSLERFCERNKCTPADLHKVPRHD